MCNPKNNTINHFIRFYIKNKPIYEVCWLIFDNEISLSILRKNFNKNVAIFVNL